jgi:transcriptional regulator with XRE-family HTH domain
LAESENRADLGRFLRSRRQRIRPSEVGLPGGARRRAPGLRREEIALLAGVSPTWYTYLEQGRDIRPSPELLESLARVLQLTPDERRYLYLLASGHAPPVASTVTPSVASAADATAVGEVISTVSVGDIPVYTGNVYGDVTFWNEAAKVWYTDFARLPDNRRNILWWQLTAPEARERLVNWADDTKELMARFRLASVSRPGDQRFRELIEAFLEASPEFGTWWESYQISGLNTRIRRLRRADGAVRSFEVVILRMIDDFNSVVLHVPKPDSD